MSDHSQPTASASGDGLQPDGGPDAGCQKRLHGMGENGTTAAAAGAAEQQPDCAATGGDCEFGEPEPPQKRVKVDPDSELDIRFLICSKEAGAIIGKGGANINHLRKDVSMARAVLSHYWTVSSLCHDHANDRTQYKSTVTIPDCPGPERVLSVGTRLDVLPDLLKEITLLMDDPQRTAQDKDVELRLLIHTSHAGGIIGRGGQRIKELREETKAAIKVFSQCCPQSTERVCAVQGPVHVVIDAIRVVLDVIVATNIKGTVKLYDPFNFDAYAAAEYGGYGDPALPAAAGRPVRSPGAGSSQRLLDPAARAWDWTRQQQRPGSYLMDRRDMQLAAPAASYPRWPAPDARHRSLPPMAENVAYWSESLSAENSAGLPPHAVGWAWPMGQPADPADLIQNPDGSASATLTVPNNVAGAIIGKGGSRIRLVRKDSGAEISIENGSGTGSDRKVTVKGNANQVRIAYSLLQQSIADHSR